MLKLKFGDKKLISVKSILISEKFWDVINNKSVAMLYQIKHCKLIDQNVYSSIDFLLAITCTISLYESIAKTETIIG